MSVPLPCPPADELGTSHPLPAPGREMGGEVRPSLSPFPFRPSTRSASANRHRVGLRGLAPGGLEIETCILEVFAGALTRSNHTLKRALTDPHLFSGIGNAYSDEILHAAQLSPIAQTQKLKAEEWERLFSATRATLELWIERLRAGHALLRGKP